jgi:hypothetical protein
MDAVKPTLEEVKQIAALPANKGFPDMNRHWDFSQGREFGGRGNPHQLSTKFDSHSIHE